VDSQFQDTAANALRFTGISLRKAFQPTKDNGLSRVASEVFKPSLKDDRLSYRSQDGSPVNLDLHH
jgi:hypothetical protein